MQRTPQVVIIGAGFAGLNAAKRLQSAPVRITVLDRRNHHLFQPLLYQVAAAALNPSDIAMPIRHILRRQKNTEVLLGEVTEVDPAGKRVHLDVGSVSYDYLIIATGATHSYFGNEQWSRFAPGLKTIEDALIIRRRVLLAYEMAERERDPELQQRWLNFIIVGAGPTGVELAGALAEISRQTLERDFRRIDPTRARIILLEGAPRVLPPYPEDLSEAAKRQLIKLGVEVHTGAQVTSIDGEGAVIGSQRIPARTVIWAAGVAASPLARSLGVALDRAGRVVVEQDLSVPGHPEIFVVGDLAAAKSDGKPVPGVAPAAIQEGRHAALNIAREIRGLGRLPFRYRDKGSLATIGRAAAVADLGRVKFTGLIAWLAWLVVHIFYLIGFRNRMLVLLEWAWSYLTTQRGARLITGFPADEEVLAPPQAPAAPLPSAASKARVDSH
ncbi:MAG TPA: NAD(P)/FAD-dependent oxidoreductase [Myxococcaceae bacterium]|nr:NAD(P)/FAD-dependent oxidoreductase [Myxococcaceae bacterium]